MKYFISIVLCLFLFSCVKNKNVNNAKNDLSKHHYKGSVKMVITSTWNADSLSGKVDKGDLLMTDTEKYNEAGFMTEWNSYNKGTQLNHQHMMWYDAHNNLIKDSNYELNIDDYNQSLGTPERMVYTYIYKYDTSGNILEKKETSDEKLVKKEVNTVDEHGNAIESKTYGEHDTLKSFDIVKYNAHGDIIESTQYGPNGKPIYKYTVLYDKDWNMYEFTRYGADGSVQSRDSMKYDAGGNVTSQISYGADMKPNLTWRYNYSSYDHTKNWLKMTFYDRAHALWIKERTIQYY